MLLIPSLPAQVPLWAVIAGLYVHRCRAIFGVLPARKAAKLDPIDCLRYELIDLDVVLGGSVGTALGLGIEY